MARSLQEYSPDTKANAWLSLSTLAIFSSMLLLFPLGLLPTGVGQYGIFAFTFFFALLSPTASYINKYSFIMLSLFAVVNISFIYNLPTLTEPYDYVSEIMRYIWLFLVGNSVINLILDNKLSVTPIKIYKYLLIIISIQVIVIIISLLPGISDFAGYWFDWQKNKTFFGGLLLGQNTFRLTGTFENPNYLGFFSIMQVLVLLSLRPSISKLQFWAVLAILSLFVVTSMSRAALLSLGLIFLINWPILTISGLIFIALFLVQYIRV